MDLIKPKFVEKIYLIMECNIYSALLLAFLSKGEAILNVMLFLNFVLWLIIIKFDFSKVSLLKNSVSIFFYLYILSIIISTFFSINPSYSFSQLLKDPLKAFLFFPVFLWIIDNESKLKRIAFVFFLLLIIYNLNGYYSFIFKDIYHSDTWLLHTTLNRYGGLLTLFIPFGILYFFYKENIYLKIFNILLMLATIFAIILNATRTAYLSLIIVLFLWSIFYFRKNIIKGFVLIFLSLSIVGIAGWYSSDFVKTKIIKTKEDINTFNYRTIGWLSAIESSLNRPIIGWGYGKKIFHEDVPFLDTSYKTSPKKLNIGLETPHNTFFAILFQQGFLGFLTFMGVFFFTIKNLLFRLRFDKNFLNLIRFSVLTSYIGYFGIFAFFNPTKFFYFSIFTVLSLSIFNILRKINK
ncbi:O-antigen ligase [Thermodesulfovibrio aggregans]|uniref:O-antigen ligase n=1 Tax=Thermodesulfovibrio aggregans TaxID=86166 RepID=A0A0U9HVY3_9BACT|nr:O-antigen ligase family protein [Thermodesulfovibrio aggregans]GAQ94591.1 O-antigen ligase [Thermodesulfovibrio aggregans]